MKLNRKSKMRLGRLIALNEIISDYLETIKTDLRNLTDTELKELNINDYFHITPSDYTPPKKIVNADYDRELAELKKKYEDYTVNYETKHNYKIKYEATNTSKSSAEIIIKDILGLTKEDLRNAIKSVK